MKTWLFQLALFLSSSFSSGCEYECNTTSSNSYLIGFPCPLTPNFRHGVFQTYVEENVLREHALMGEDRTLDSEELYFHLGTSSRTNLECILKVGNSNSNSAIVLEAFDVGSTNGCYLNIYYTQTVHPNSENKYVFSSINIDKNTWFRFYLLTTSSPAITLTDWSFFSDTTCTYVPTPPACDDGIIIPPYTEPTISKSYTNSVNLLTTTTTSTEIPRIKADNELSSQGLTLIILIPLICFLVILPMIAYGVYKWRQEIMKKYYAEAVIIRAPKDGKFGNKNKKDQKRNPEKSKGHKHSKHGGQDEIELTQPKAPFMPESNIRATSYTRGVNRAPNSPPPQIRQSSLSFGAFPTTSEVNIFQNPNHSPAAPARVFQNRRTSGPGVFDWNVDRVGQWLSHFGSEYNRYRPEFREAGVTGVLLADLTEQDIRSLGVEDLEHLNVLMKDIKLLESQTERPPNYYNQI